MGARRASAATRIRPLREDKDPCEVVRDFSSAPSVDSACHEQSRGKMLIPLAIPET